MADPAVPYSLLDRIDALERTVRALSRAPTLGQTSVQGGRVRIYSSAGVVILVIGDLDAGGIGTEFYDDDGQLVGRFGSLEGGTRDGFELYANGVRVMRGDERGVMEPYVSMPMIPEGSLSVTGPHIALAQNSSNTDVGVARVNKLVSQYVRVFVSIEAITSTNGGTFRMIVTGSGVSSQTTSSFAVTIGDWRNYRLDLQLTAPLGTTDLKFQLQCNHAAGAGTINVIMPTMVFGDFSATATTSGSVTSTVV